MSFLGEGRKGGETAQEPGGDQGKDPGRGGSGGVIPEKTADQEAAKEVTGENPEWKPGQAGFFGENLDGFGEAPSCQRTEATPEKDQ